MALKVIHYWEKPFHLLAHKRRACSKAGLESGTRNDEPVSCHGTENRRMIKKCYYLSVLHQFIKLLIHVYFELSYSQILSEKARTSPPLKQNTQELCQEWYS